MKSNLPTGWTWMTLGDLLLRITNGYSQNQNNEQLENYLPITRIETIADGTINLERVKYVPTPSEKDVEHFQLRQGDVLLSHINSDKHLGKTAYFDLSDTTIIHGINLLLLRFDNTTTSKYIHYLLGFYRMQGKFMEIAQRAVNQSSINQKKLRALSIPVAPLAEQSRIVAQLEAVMQKLEASQERLDKLPDLLKKFRQAVLAAAVSGKLTEAWRAEQSQGETGADLLDRIRAERRAQWEDKQQAKLSGKQLSLNDSWKSKYEEPSVPDTSELPELPEGWVWVQVGDVVSKVSDGPFGSNLKSDDYVDEPGFQVIRLENIGWMEFIAGKETFISEEKFISLEKHEVFESDIIFSSFISGNIRAVLLRELPYRAINKADCFCIRDEFGFSCKGFLEMALSSETSFRQLVSTVHGSTRPRINTTQLRELIIPLPSFAEQQEIVRQVNHYFGLADQLEARFEQAAALVEQLPQALLAKAFSGQLVPQDPDDEPASALLERLQAEPAAPVKGKRGRKAKVATEAPLFE